MLVGRVSPSYLSPTGARVAPGASAVEPGNPAPPRAWSGEGGCAEVAGRGRIDSWAAGAGSHWGEDGGGVTVALAAILVGGCFPIRRHQSRQCAGELARQRPVSDVEGAILAGVENRLRGADVVADHGGSGSR